MPPCVWEVAAHRGLAWYQPAQFLRDPGALEGKGFESAEPGKTAPRNQVIEVPG